jgi:hypothetical protein
VPGLFDEPGPAGSVYEILRSDERAEPRALRTRFEEMWAVYEPYADPHFLIEFHKVTNARYWEMYLTCAFIAAGLSVDSSPEGPDILVTRDGARIWVEAVEATQGAESSADRTLEFGNDVVFDYPEEQILLRYRNAIEAKHEKLKRYLENGIVQPEDAYVIAVNSGLIPYAFMTEEPPRIANAVYPMGAIQAHVSTETGELLSVDSAYRPTIAKASGSTVSTDVFLDEAYAGISGVIYSGANAWNMPSSMGSDLALVHNLMATVSLPMTWYPFKQEWAARFVGRTLMIERIGRIDVLDAKGE